MGPGKHADIVFNILAFGVGINDCKDQPSNYEVGPISLPKS